MILRKEVPNLPLFSENIGFDIRSWPDYPLGNIWDEYKSINLRSDIHEFRLYKNNHFEICITFVNSLGHIILNNGSKSIRYKGDFKFEKL